MQYAMISLTELILSLLLLCGSIIFKVVSKVAEESVGGSSECN